MKAIGVDLGGTWIRATLVDKDGSANEVLKTPTRRHRPPEEIVADLISLASQLKTGTETPIVGIGLGVPTTFDKKGWLDPCPNLPTMGKYPLQDVLSRHLGIPVWMENDAQCFALGEWYYGVGKGTGVLAGITLGTGLGLGIVIEGKLFRGAHGKAGEIWQAPANIASLEERPENIESLVSGTAIEQMYEQKSGRSLQAEQIVLRVEQHEQLACSVFESFAQALRNVLLWISALLDPDMIALGGSVTKSMAHFYDVVAADMRARNIAVFTSELGDLTALYGAATLVFSNNRKEKHEPLYRRD